MLLRRGYDTGFVAVSEVSDTGYAVEEWLWGCWRAGGILVDHNAPCSPWICYRPLTTGPGDHQEIWTAGTLFRNL